jgi:hypothetical protein
VTFSIGIGIYTILRSRLLPKPAVAEVSNLPSHEPPASSSTDDEWTSFEDLLTDDERMEYNGYLIETRYKSVKFYEQQMADQGYVVLSQDDKVIRSFDGNAYHPLGNITKSGLFSFLGLNEKQLAISQDVNRGGVQWIVDLSPTPRVIFDGVAWGIGREAADCEVKDLDGDGIFEITLPITDFYSFMDKMAVGNVPLPMITFKYDPNKAEYFPAMYVFDLDQPKPPDILRGNDLYFRSRVLDHMLDLIYKGKRRQAWQYFHTTYNLSDKKEIEQRVQNILSRQPIYKYIYKNQ